jgi:2-polyprenyl-3-methyl-5-hydroxy-6-metoxy-1,4-benzoquinol methylase
MSEIRQSRMDAAIASGGISTDAIYDSVLSILSEKSASGSVLDFGAGNGFLTRRLVDCGMFSEVSAIDILPRPDLPKSVSWANADLNSTPTIWTSKFDFVVAVEVIEHLENPRETFRTVSRFLKPGGTAVVTTPNCENIRSYLALVLKRQFYAFTDSSYPAHITSLLESDMRRCALEAGLRDIQIDYRVIGSLPRFTRLTWQHLNGRLKGRLFSDCMIATCRRTI